MNKNKSTSYIILFFIICLFGILGLNSLNPSKPNYDDLSKINVNNLMTHISQIAKEPHSIYDVEAKGKVRDYLTSELNKLGASPKIYEYNDVYVKRSDSYEDLQNIYAEIKGKSDSYIMLVTHYDSSRAKAERYAEKDGSHGAADAGYGLSTILETLRVIKENNIELENGIKILFTDGEEAGLLGAKEAVNEAEIFNGVNYLINLEARGTSGPAVMFETSPNNSAIVDLYSSTDKAFSYSITPEIYRLLPNGTDFTVFLENKIPGINISVLDGMENYHTPNDNPNNLSYESMQHYGDQVLPIVTEFVSNSKYSDSSALISNDDSIFFSLGNLFIKYSKATNYILISLILICIIYLYMNLKSKNLIKVFKYTFINLVYTVISMGIAYFLTRVLAIINGRQFKITYLPLIKYESTILILFILITFIGYIFTIKKFTHNLKEKNEYLIGSLVLLLLLSIILTLSLPGASYITVFPGVLISITSVITKALKDKYNLSCIMLIPIALITLLFVPTVYLFNAALTLGGLCANILFVMIGFISIISSSIFIKGINTY
ncbi:M20/M25/M40 family metallo-hydrolase [Clostridium gallinarum]|uniref:M20/M25/M40 family metallo-hydrolase n=1 Tax=Clostridium gallinarum TaxID=2762246 RepID=UPI001A9AF643|nr:M20/M25/M40 family metallo-hydrolase [Clostridium gallinarum]